MTLKWGKEKIKGLSNPVNKVERTSDWSWWWGLFGVVILIAVAVILKM